MAAFSGTEHEMEGRVGTWAHFRRKNIEIHCINKKSEQRNYEIELQKTQS